MVTTTPTVIVPSSPAMASEPARTIGAAYAGRQDVRLFITTLFALAAAVGLHVASGVSDQVLILADLIIPVALMLYARWKLAQNARQQAEATRDAVYAPTTVADLVAEHDAETDVVVRQFPRTASDPDGDGRMNL